MSDKSLGQIAFEAHRRLMVEAKFPAFLWTELDDWERDIWEATAEAVVRHLKFGPVGSRIRDTQLAEKAVIEAARTLAKKDAITNWRLLRDAVKALEAAEKGE